MVSLFCKKIKYICKAYEMLGGGPGLLDLFVEKWCEKWEHIIDDEKGLKVETFFK